MSPQRVSVLPVAVLFIATSWWVSRADDTLPPKEAEGKTTQKRSNEEPKDDEPDEVNHFMRLKLAASSKILEGLATEDFTLIKEGAREMNKMSSREKWRVTNDALYRNFSGDFQRVTKDLIEAADEENLDRAALKWMDATMSCIECHRYARGIMIASIDLDERP